MSQDLPENTTGTVVWDYHVVAVERDATSSVIYDLTRYYQYRPLSFMCSVREALSSVVL